MKSFFQIFFFLLTWFTNHANATTVFTKVALLSNEFSFSKVENVKEESFVKIFRANLEYETGSLKYLDELNKEGLFFYALKGEKVTTFSNSYTILTKVEDVYIDVNGLVSKKNLTFYTNSQGKIFYVVEEVVNGVGSLVNKLDNAIFSSLKGKVNQLDNILKPQFLDDFANASDDVLKKLQDENLFDVWKNDIRSSNIDDLRLFESKGDVRLKYKEALEAFIGEEEKLLKFYDLAPNKYEKVAEAMFDLRLKTTTRFKVEETPADLLEWIYKFNEKRYIPIGGNKYGHTWESIVATNKSKGFSADDLYKKIIESSKTPLGDGDKMVLGDALKKAFENEFDFNKLKIILEKYRLWRY